MEDTEPAGRLTEQICRDTKPEKMPDGSYRRVMLADGRGLYLSVDQGKHRVTKSWIFRFTFAGATRQMGLGTYKANKITLAKARKARDAQRELIDAGKDPLVVKQLARAAVKKQRTELKRETITFGKAAEAFIKTHKAAWSSEKTLAAWERIETYAANLWPMDTADISTRDVLKAVEPLWLTHNTTAKNLRSRIELILDWAMAKGFRPEVDNPAAFKRLKHLLPDASKIAKTVHHPALHYDHIAQFMTELRAIEKVEARCLEFLILCAVRTDEARCAKWGELNLEQCEWTIPADRMKMELPHTVPLSTRAVEILTVLRGEDVEPNDYVFYKPDARRVSSRPIAQDAMLRIASHLREGITVHGFRSTFRDWCGDCTDTPREIAEQALAHIVGGVEGSYRRGTALDKRRALMQQWQAHCVGAVILPFTRTAA
jgi:integrase